MVLTPKTPLQKGSELPSVHGMKEAAEKMPSPAQRYLWMQSTLQMQWECFLPDKTLWGSRGFIPPLPISTTTKLVQKMKLEWVYVTKGSLRAPGMLNPGSCTRKMACFPGPKALPRDNARENRRDSQSPRSPLGDPAHPAPLPPLLTAAV